MISVGIALVSFLDAPWMFKALRDEKDSVGLVAESLDRLVGMLPEYSFVRRVFCVRGLEGYYEGRGFEYSVVDVEVYALLEACLRQFEDCAHVMFVHAHCPLNDAGVMKELLELHVQEMAEYSFTENYPIGIGGEVLDLATLHKLKNIAEGNNERFTLESIKKIVYFDVNYYDVEVLVSPIDFRPYRLEYTCDLYRNYELCRKMLHVGPASVVELAEYVAGDASLMRTVPAYVELELTNECHCECVICPRTSLMNRPITQLSTESYRRIITELKNFCHEYTLALGFMGEPFLHPELLNFIEYALSLGGITLILETNGIFLTKERADQLAQLNTEHLKVIIALDTPDPKQYQELRSVDELERVEKNAAYLLQRRPKDTYLQILRLKENEAQLDLYYKRWSAFKDQILIQKYNTYKNALPDRKAADLSPLTRHFACVHLKRDLVILSDGRIPFCKQDINAKDSVGNILTDGLAVCWGRLESSFISDHNKDIAPQCQDCDEWFTYNG